MNQAPGIKTTMNVPPDVREQLEAWAAFHVSSMTAEMIRSVRERAERERKQREKAG